MTTDKPTLGVDCDDVLLDFMRALFIYLNYRLSRNYTYEEITSYNLAEFLSLSEEVKQGYVEEFYLSAEFRKLSLIEGALEGILELVQICRPVVITSRHKEHEPHTRANLALHSLDMLQEMRLLGHYDQKVRPEDRLSKGLICKEMSAIGCIEDGPGNALEIAAHGVPVILPDRPWNRGVSSPLIMRVFSWPEIVTEAKRLINK